MTDPNDEPRGRNEPPPTRDPVYLGILGFLVASALFGTVLAFFGERLTGTPAAEKVGVWGALISIALYFFFRWRGRQALKRLAEERREGSDGGPRG